MWVVVPVLVNVFLLPCLWLVMVVRVNVCTWGALSFAGVNTEQDWLRYNGPGPETRWYHLLNEAVVKRQNRLSGVSEIQVFVDDEYLAKFKGDGLIIASPTGSTAYSMAAGGSIVHPHIDALLLTPLNSFTLASRPLLLPGHALIRLHVRTDSVYAKDN